VRNAACRQGAHTGAGFHLLTAGERTHGYDTQVGSEEVRGKESARQKGCAEEKSIGQQGIDWRRGQVGATQGGGEGGEEVGCQKAGCEESGIAQGGAKKSLGEEGRRKEGNIQQEGDKEARRKEDCNQEDRNKAGGSEEAGGQKADCPESGAEEDRPEEGCGKKGRGEEGGGSRARRRQHADEARGEEGGAAQARGLERCTDPAYQPGRGGRPYPGPARCQARTGSTRAKLARCQPVASCAKCRGPASAGVRVGWWRRRPRAGSAAQRAEQAQGLIGAAAAQGEFKHRGPA